MLCAIIFSAEEYLDSSQDQICALARYTQQVLASNVLERSLLELSQDLANFDSRFSDLVNQGIALLCETDAGESNRS